MAFRFARDGHTVVVNSRSAPAIEAVAEEIRQQGGKAIAIAADVTDPVQVSKMVKEAEEQAGPVDVLVNNAVMRVQRPMLEMSDEEWQLVIDTVLTGAFYCTRAVLKPMIERRWGRIVNMAGQTGQRGAANRVGVVAAKSGLIGLTKAVAHEVAQFGVTVNAISPGSIATERIGIIGETRTQGERRTAEVSLMGRQGEMSEIAGVCSFLCSDDAAFITGQVIAANGGSYM
jgi:NAD(P)-dependent dehydrogenase (short-subunit alcohol dehydrogenase family)